MASFCIFCLRVACEQLIFMTRPLTPSVSSTAYVSRSSVPFCLPPGVSAGSRGESLPPRIRPCWSCRPQRGCPVSPPFCGADRNRAVLPAFFPGSVICLNNSQNSGKHFSCTSLMVITDPTPEQPDGRDAGRRVWEGAVWDSCPLSRPATLPAP